MSEPLPLYSSDALRRIEAQAAGAFGDEVLMQRAGRAAWHCALRHWTQAQRIVVVCGPGNNGGDGYVFARHALQAGRDVRVLQAGMSCGTLAERMQTAYREAGGRDDGESGSLAAAELIVDAMFGIGLSRDVDESAATTIAAINASPAPVLALDAPSGIDADSGRIRGVAIRATRTLQFIAAHPGLATGDALEHAGDREVAGLDIPDAMFETQAPAALLLRPESLATYLRPRRRNTHKGESGRVLCIGGDHGKGGAIALCAEAALRSGAGLADVATRPSHVPALLARRPEIMAHGIDDDGMQSTLPASVDVIAIGPGLGQENWGKALYSAAFDAGKPLVVDADALNILAQSPRALRDAAITPHPGEAARLLGMSTQDVQRDRYAAAQMLVERYRCAAVLKGAGTIVAAPGEMPRVIAAGNPGMAVGGMGDVLTGVIAALRAQGLSTFDAACCGALLHAVAGDAAARDGGERGLLPSDLFAQLRRLVNP